MKIGIDASKAAGAKKTGIDNTAYQIILGLQKIDKTNNYFLYTNKKIDPVLTKQKNFIERLIPFPKFWNRFRLPLALLKDKPDVFLELTANLPPAASKNSIVLIHDLAFKIFPEAYSSYELMLQEAAVNTAIKRAKKIIFSSKANYNDFLRYYKCPKNKVIVIPLAYNSLLKNSSIKSKLVDSRFPYFLYVGRIEKRKNVLNIIRAFNAFKNESKSKIKLLLIGKDGYGASTIREELNVSPFKKDILLPGYVSNDELSYIFSHAQALVYPSLYEGFGLPALEAMAYKVPVITSKVPTLEEVVGDAALLVNPLDEIDIANAMKKIVTDKKLRQELIKNGLLNIKKYSWDKTAKEFLKIIESLK